MGPSLQSSVSPASSTPKPAVAARAWERLRALPIRLRILLIATLNILVAVVFSVFVWNGAQVLSAARSDLQDARDSDRQLTLLESQAGRLQSLIHRYFTQPDDELLREITGLRASLLSTLQDRAFVS